MDCKCQFRDYGKLGLNFIRYLKNLEGEFCTKEALIRNKLPENLKNFSFPKSFRSL